MDVSVTQNCEIDLLYVDGHATDDVTIVTDSNTSPVETTPLIERELYADNEMQDVSETPAEYDDTAIILNNAVELTSMPIAALELNSTGPYRNNCVKIMELSRFLTVFVM